MNIGRHHLVLVLVLVLDVEYFQHAYLSLTNTELAISAGLESIKYASF